ncbi:hypothetical protein ABIA33_002184 [Streptacidiphilus sp. MAP12-16]|uniref:hypothetical protein n=1 Tax=Streptacidiphilus sp. MAP12-16 TaxID=3156300 RepID=UPI003512C129
MVIVAGGPPAATSSGDSREEGLLTGRSSIIAWCDRHLTTMHALAALMADEPRVIAAALAELLAEPQDLPAPRRTRRDANPARAVSRDRCPRGASPLDRVEIALDLLGDRTCAKASEVLGLPEYAVAARLRSGLWVLFAPCDRRTGARAGPIPLPSSVAYLPSPGSSGV